MNRIPTFEEFINESSSNFMHINDKKYKLELKEVEEGDYVVVATKGSERVGELRFIISKFKPVLKATTVSVDPSHRREGIGSSMYQFAEKELGKPFVRNEDVLTPDGKALWNNKNRKFGK